MPAAPATQPRPKIGVRFTSRGKPMMLARRASMLGQAMPVTEVKKIAEMSAGSRPASIECVLDGLLAQFKRSLDPEVVRDPKLDSVPSESRGYMMCAVIDAAICVKPVHDCRRRQCVLHSVFQCLRNHGLRVPVRRKSGANRCNAHGSKNLVRRVVLRISVTSDQHQPVLLVFGRSKANLWSCEDKCLKHTGGSPTGRWVKYRTTTRGRTATKVS